MTWSIVQWIAQANDERERRLRQAVRTVLHAIALSERLRGSMLIKGGMLLAIHYNNDRFTKDVDFSTEEQARTFDRQAFLDELETRLADAVEMKPPQSTATFPTLQIKIAHAPFGSPEHQRLVKGQCPTVLAIDYSLNEFQLFEPTAIDLGDGSSVQAYSLPDLIGEKYRAMLQQEVRGRTRGQDVYDLHRLLCNTTLSIESDDELRHRVHLSLVKKSAARNIEANATSMRVSALIERLNRSYGGLTLTVESLPPFSTVHERVARYYESLPWPTSEFQHDNSGR